MKIWAALGIVALAVFTVGGLMKVSYSAGYRSAQQEVVRQIEKENTDAGNSAENWRDRLRACDDSGGVFDFASGTCDR